MILNTLIKLANKLDSEGKTKAADKIDRAIMKISTEMDGEGGGELVEFRASPAEQLKEEGEEGSIFVFLSFLEALADGAFENIEEAQKVAVYFLKEYGPKQKPELSLTGEEPELGVKDTGEIGEVIEFDFGNPQ